MKSPAIKLTSLRICATMLTLSSGGSAQLSVAEMPRRLIAIDNVCAWPNLVKLQDGSLVAIVFNQPNHGRTEGDVDCWGSTDSWPWKSSAPSLNLPLRPIA